MPSVDDVFSSGQRLKAQDILGKRINVQIERVSVENVGGQDRKPVAYFVGKEKNLVLNATNANMIADLLGTREMDDWGGHWITLYTTKTTYQGKRVDCIRVAEQLPRATAQAARPAPTPPPAPPVQTREAGWEPDDSDVPFSLLLPFLGALPLIGAVLA